jgi:hypothetical protein
LPEDLTPARCPRCGDTFGCGAANASPCACTRVRLSEALRTQLRESYSGCLCLGCLLALGAQPVVEPARAAPGAKDAATGR